MRAEILLEILKASRGECDALRRAVDAVKHAPITQKQANDVIAALTEAKEFNEKQAELLSRALPERRFAGEREGL